MSDGKRVNCALDDATKLRYERRMLSSFRYIFSRRHLRTLAILMVAACTFVCAAPTANAQLNSDDRAYDSKLLRLSELLGAIHYLRELCGAGEGQIWRNQMRRIIETEGTTAIRRAKLVKEFNKGYRGYRRTYRSCTEPAKIAIDRFMDEGSTLADLLIKDDE